MAVGAGILMGDALKCPSGGTHSPTTREGKTKDGVKTKVTVCAKCGKINP